MPDYEPLFCHEEQKKLVLHGASAFRCWLYNANLKIDASVLIWLLIIVFGYRTGSREAVQRVVQEVVSEGSRLARVASDGTLLRFLPGRRAASSGQICQSGAACPTGDFAAAAAEAVAEAQSASRAVSSRLALPLPSAAAGESRQLNPQQEQLQLPPPHSPLADGSRKEWLFGLIERHTDSVLVGLLGYKLALLVLYTMPISYGFGVKRVFLKWASRAKLFRVYLQLAPFVGLAATMAAGAAVQYSRRRRPLDQATVTRWRALALLNA
ncbi:unnamed protein product, partial [Polarella glacialis]